VIQAPQGDLGTSNIFWLTDEQMARLQPFTGQSIHRIDC
jgi:hypothetical protein